MSDERPEYEYATCSLGAVEHAAIGWEVVSVHSVEREVAPPAVSWNQTSQRNECAHPGVKLLEAHCLLRRVPNSRLKRLSEENATLLSNEATLKKLIEAQKKQIDNLSAEVSYANAELQKARAAFEAKSKADREDQFKQVQALRDSLAAQEADLRVLREEFGAERVNAVLAVGHVQRMKKDEELAF